MKQHTILYYMGKTKSQTIDEAEKKFNALPADEQKAIIDSERKETHELLTLYYESNPEKAPADWRKHRQMSE